MLRRLAAIVIALVLLAAAAGAETTVTWWQLSIGGFIAGYGARLSNGCTSGHGVCGLASLQVPSLLAVIIFLGCAMISAALVKSLGGV